MLTSPHWFWEQSSWIVKNQGQGGISLYRLQHSKCKLYLCVFTVLLQIINSSLTLIQHVNLLSCLPGSGCQWLSGNGTALWHRIHSPCSHADSDPEGPGQALHHPHRQLLRQQGKRKHTRQLLQSPNSRWDITIFCFNLIYKVININPSVPSVHYTKGK